MTGTAATGLAPVDRASGRRMDRVLDWVFGLFGVWTIGVHVTVLRGGNLYDAQVNIAIALGVCAALFFLLRRFSAQVAPMHAPGTELGSERDELSARVRMGGVLLALAAVTTLAGVNRSNHIVWGAALVAIVFASARAWKLIPNALTPRVFRRQSIVLVLLALACAAAVLFVHRADSDDAFYINIAVAIVDMPREALLSWDTMHGIRDAPILLPVYRLHTLEVLVGALSHWSGVAAIRVFHIGVPFVAALLAPYAFARLLRLLSPQRWLIGVVVVVAYYLLIGDPPRGFTNLGFVRMHQGKAILLTLVLPLLCAQSIEFALAPGLRRWAILFLTQAGAVGLTANAVWMAPVVVALALGSTIAIDARGLRRLFIGICSTAYPLAAALVIRASTVSTLGALERSFPDEGLFPQPRRAVLGNDPIGWLALLAIFGGWCFVRGHLARRVLTVFPLVLLVVFWNPFSATFVADTLVGRPTYWRVFWILPIPIFVALLMLQWLRAERGHIGTRQRTSLALIVFVGVLAARFVSRGFPDPEAPLGGLGIARELPLPTILAALVWSIGLERAAFSRIGWRLSGIAFVAFCLLPKTYTLAESGRIFHGAPQPKVTRIAYDAAERIAELAPQGSVVLAPFEVAEWIPTVHGYSYPLVVRKIHMRPLSGSVLTAQEVSARFLLANAVSGERRPEQIAGLMKNAVAAYDLSLVCLDESTRDWNELRPAIEAAGFRFVEAEGRYEYWTRRP